MYKRLVTSDDLYKSHKTYIVVTLKENENGRKSKGCDSQLGLLIVVVTDTSKLLSSSYFS